MEGEQRVRIIGGRLDGKTGVLAGEGDAGYGVILDDTNHVLSFKRWEVEILPDDDAPNNLGRASPQPA